MAKQNSYLKIKGRLGDLSFYKMQGEHLVREKSGVDGKRIATDPAYARTRENNAEFARAATAGKLLRTALRSVLLRVADNRVTARMSKEMLRVVKADKVSTRGARNVIDGEAELLEGFNFNSHCPLNTVLYAPYTAAIDRVAGTLQIDVPPFIPENAIASPTGATHFSLICSGAEVDFEGNQFNGDTLLAANLPIDHLTTAAISLTVNVTPASTKPLFLAFGIVFFQEVNDDYYSLKNGVYNAIALVKVSGV
jgi:hypothetical protein